MHPGGVPLEMSNPVGPSAFSPVSRPTQEEEDAMPISVAIRICPLHSPSQASSCVHGLLPATGDGGIQGFTTDLTFTGKSGEQQRFHFGQVFPESSHQKTVFEQSLEPLLSVLFDGYDLSVVTYGQAGSGKTHSLAGPMTDGHLATSEEDFGLILRSVRSIFKNISLDSSNNDEDDSQQWRVNSKDILVRVSFIDIDNQNVRDLLSDNPNQLIVSRSPETGGVTMAGLTEIECNSTAEVWSCYQMGMSVQQIRRLNQSFIQPKSHTIFTISLTQYESQWCKKSSLRFVEIVSSDQLYISKPPVRQQIIQHGMFPPPPLPNFSFHSPSVDIGLLSLDNVVSALGDPRRKISVVPYNNSILTSLLRDVFGGSCVTLVLCCVLPSIVNAEETLNTLTFASRAANIKNLPVPNVRTVTSPQQHDEDDLELLETNFAMSRRPSELSEILGDLRSVSATGGRMPDLVNNVALGQHHGLLGQNNGFSSLNNGLLGQMNGFPTQNNGLPNQMNGLLSPNNGLPSSNNGFPSQINRLLNPNNGLQNQINGLINPSNGFPNQINGFPSLNNNPAWSTPGQLQLQLLQQLQWNQQFQQTYEQQQQQLYIQHLIAQQQQGLLRPQQLHHGMLANPVLGQAQDPRLLNLYAEHSEMPSSIRMQLESPFIPINHISPLPEDVSPLSQQKSPLSVTMYLQHPPLAANNCSSPLESLTQLNTVTLPVNLPAAAKGENEATHTEKKDTPRKSETRRSSLANQNKLTRILEESEHEASSPSANSSKEIIQRSINESENFEDDGDGDIDDDEGSEDFNSECSAMSDLEPTINQLLDQFREDTQTLVFELESNFFLLEPTVNDHEVDMTKAIEDLLIVAATPVIVTGSSKNVQNSDNAELRKELYTKLKNLSAIHESKKSCVERSEEVLGQVEVQLNAIQKTIQVKCDLLDELICRDKELKASKKIFKKRIHVLSEEFNATRLQLLEAKKNLLVYKDSSKKKQVDSLQSTLDGLQEKINRTKEISQILLSGEDPDSVAQDLERCREMQTQLHQRLLKEEEHKAQLLSELESERATIEHLESQLLLQEEQIRLSAQFSQEFEHQKVWLASEESRLERTRLENELLQRSLKEQQTQLDIREKSLQFHQDGEKTRAKSERQLRDEIKNCREFKDLILVERTFLEHFMEHYSPLKHCLHCLRRDPTRGQDESAETPIRRTVELDTYLEGVDNIIDFKTDLISNKAVDYIDNTDNPDNIVMAMLCKLTSEEAKSLLHKYVKRLIDMRCDGVKKDAELRRMQLELEHYSKHIRDLDFTLSVIESENKRKLDLQAIDFSKKNQYLMSINNIDVIKSYERKLEDLYSQYKKYKDAYKILRKKMEMSTDDQERRPQDERKKSDGSDVSGLDPERVRKFVHHIKSQPPASDRSTVTQSGKKLIIQQMSSDDRSFKSKRK